MITQIAAPDVALRCDGCGEVWYFTADEPLDASERDEFIEPVTMPLSEALRRIEAAEIVDAKTIVALLFAAGFRTNS